MTRGLKTTIIYSSLLACALNAAQFLSSFDQRQDALAAKWTLGLGGSGSNAQVTTVSAGSARPADSAKVSAVAAKLAASNLKTDFTTHYLSVQAQTGTPWQLLAAVHQIETGQRGDTAITSYAGAQGPMQFMPATWNSYGRDGDGDGRNTITDIDDAMLGAGTYLAANGAAEGRYDNALYRYNHSWASVADVKAIALRLGL